VAYFLVHLASRLFVHTLGRKPGSLVRQLIVSCTFLWNAVLVGVLVIRIVFVHGLFDHVGPIDAVSASGHSSVQ